jgi:hypothetical protein
MAGTKTKVIDRSVDDFISGLEYEQRRLDAEVLQRLFSDITQLPAPMWGAKYRRLWRLSLSNS